MRLSNLRYRHLSFDDLPAVEDWMAFTAAHGFAGIELIYRAWPCDWHVIHRTKKLLRQYGLSVSMVTSSHDNSVLGEEEQRRAVATLEGYIDLAAELESQFVRVLARGYDPQRKEVSRERAIDAAVAAFERALPYAARQGVTLALENHPGFGVEKEVIAAILARLPDDHFGWNCDFVNAYRLDGQSLDDFLSDEALLQRLVYVHAKTFTATPDGWDVAVALDAGDLPVADFLRTIRARGYDGWISIEFGAADREVLLQSQRFIQEVWSR